MTTEDELGMLRQQARLHREESRWREAITLFQQVVALAPHDIDSYNELGLLYETTGELTRSEQSYLKALELDPDNADTLLNLGCFYMDQERFPEALLTLQWCARVTSLGSDSYAEAVKHIADILAEHGHELKSSGWTQVTETMGYMAADMAASHLRTLGIPAWAWQEGAGQAFGLSVGTLGTGHVLVLEKDAAEARTILAELEAAGREMEAEADLEQAEGEDGESSTAGPLTKAILGATALVMNPIGTGLAYLLSQFDQLSLGEVETTCPHCGVVLILDENEWLQGWYQCPECGQEVELAELGELDEKDE